MSVATSGGSSQFARTRGRMQGGSYGIAYPHPFFDVASTYTPQNMQSLFRWLRTYFLLNGFLNTVVYKLAEYPITDLIFTHKSEETSRKWTTYYEDTLRYRSFQVEVGLDFFVYGNAFVSARYPIHKWLKCSSCGKLTKAEGNRSKWTFRNYTFRLKCSCGHEGPAQVVDIAVRTAENVSLLRWDPELLQILYNPLTRRKTYYLTVPAGIRQDVMTGRQDVVEELPQVFIDACKNNEKVILPEDEVFHLARPSISGFDPGWGCPLLLPVLREAFQLQVMRKAQETVLLEHLIPLRVLFPQPAAGTADPFTSVPLPLWKQDVAQQIARWRWDPAYYPIMPLPIGQQTIGGDGKALMIQPEMQALIEQIIVSIGVPKEFIFGGAAWSGSNVSLRTVENFFLGFIHLQLQLARFVQRKVAAVTSWPLTDIRFKPFRMADDMMRKQWLLAMAQGGKISDTTLLNEADFDAKTESELMEKEVTHQIAAQRKKQIEMAKLQGEVGSLTAKYQMEVQQQMAAAQAGPPGPGGPGGPPGPGGPAPVVGQETGVDLSTGAPVVPGAEQPPPAEAVPADPATPAPLSNAQALDQTLASKLNVGQKAPNGAIPLTEQAMAMARQISIMSPNLQQVAIQNLMTSSPELYNLVMSYLSTMGSEQPAAPTEAPPPEVAPPRRASS